MTPATPSAGGFRERLRTSSWAAVAALTVCSAALTAIQTPSTARAVLVDGATFERPAAQGDTHRYDVELTAGDFLEISASQDQLLVGLFLHGPDDSLILGATDIAPIPLPMRLLAVAPVSGWYRLNVHVEQDLPRPSELNTPRATVAGAESRRYTLRVIALRAATAEDRVREGSFRTFERAHALVQLQTLEGLRQSIPIFREAASGQRAAGDAPLEALTLESLASVTAFFMEFRADAIAARERLTELYAQLGEREEEVVSLRELATRYFADGRLADAKRAAGRALERASSLGLRAGLARSERDLGLYEAELGNYQRARDLAQQSRDLAARIGEPAIEALATWDLAELDELAGDLDAAIARDRRALELAVNDRNVTSHIVVRLGFTHLRRGELDEAAARFEARLAMPRVVQKEEEALSRLGLGDVSLARGDRARARQRYEDAASALRTSYQRFRCIAEQRVGSLDLEEGRLDQARVRFETMIEIAARIQHPPCEAEGRAGLADVAARRGELDIADAEARRVVELTETFREAVASLESRSLGFGALAPAYERAIDISMRRLARGDAGSMERALMLNEQALARGLLDRIVAARIDTAARAPAALVTEHQQVRERWRARLAELQVAMRNSADSPRTKALVEETRLLAVEVRDLESRIDAADARQSSFVRPHPLRVDAMQALLDTDTLFLEYALGDERSYLWVVSPHDVRTFTLPPRAAIDTLARRVHESFGRSPARATTPDAERMAETDRRALTRVLLEPAAPLLGTQRLVIVPTGALSLVPFGALPAPGEAAQPLIARHEIVQIPSATILQAMRTLTAGRARPAKTAAIFADPLFDAHDTRVRSVRGLSLARLPFSRNEAAVIASLAPTGTTTFLGPEATRERALDRALADYRFLHFATHSVVNEDVPSLSSIALSMVDRSGRPRDGLVMLPDVYDMTLNADLVVLSGCQTALGKNVRGEGSIGLARGFMYAGVPRVVASLWEVSDLGTAELMKRFYRGMLVDGLTPAAALRAAQRELAADPRWASPYFWAPFILQGDWR